MARRNAKKTRKMPTKAKKGTKKPAVKQTFNLGWWRSLRQRRQNFLARRKHRSFRLTRKYDIPKPVKLPGYIAFTRQVFVQLYQHRQIFMRLLLVVWLTSALFIGVSQQQQYQSLQSAMDVFQEEILAGNSLAKLTQITATFLSVASGTLNTGLSESQQIFIGLWALLVWLVVIWLLRHLLAGTHVTVRDGIYNAGAPLVSTLLIMLVGVIQLLPAFLGITVYSTAQASGVLSGGIEVGAFVLVTVLLIVLSLYWITSSLFAIIISTIPGTYPMKAIKSAGDLIQGQRRMMLFRLLYLFVIDFLIILILVLPFIIIENVFELSGFSFSALALQFAVSVILIVSSAYIYLLYRKVIDAKG